MRSRKWSGVLLAGMMLLSFLTGCGEKSADDRVESKEQSQNEKVTIAFWSDQMTECYGKYLQDKFPNVEFEFYVATKIGRAHV